MLMPSIAQPGLTANTDSPIQGYSVNVPKKVSGWANTSCRFDFSQERSLCLSYVYVQW